VAQLDVSTAGQRGLLGLAVDRQGRVFAAWTDRARRLQVAQVSPGPVRPVWSLARTARLANGGRLAFASDGRLVVGIGDLQQPDRVGDPDQPNGKLLRLDPDGGPDQRPEVLSAGWHNPFAFAVTPEGEVWVADNAPGTEPERLRRGDRAGPVTRLPQKTAPSGLAAAGDGDLLVCGFVSGDLLRYRVRDDRAEAAGRLAGDCRLGVVVLADGRVAYATADSIRVFAAGTKS
jgi:glucose/arabinose dehydrogenase